MKWTFVGDWYDVGFDLAEPFTVVAEGENYETAELNAATAMLNAYPYRVEEGETPETFWGGDHGAYTCAVFEGDLSGQLMGSSEAYTLTA
ncbi:hypothetical protein ACWGCW_31585 [Streptomyces sp. NPDC054933]